ncbi:MAG: hypothetical protein NT113_04305 [Hyphomicrobiales bacterium]|nr:hypothetical protein [Hyphomicrobiales bacterium]
MTNLAGNASRARKLTSMRLADVVAAALNEEPGRIRLQLKTLRPTGGITFSGYGRGAAEMTAADAARLLIAIAGSLAAKHAADALAAFRNLEPLGPKGRGLTLEDFLAEHMDALARGGLRPGSDYYAVDRSYDLAAEEGLKLIWFAGRQASLPRAAVVRWFRADGKSDAAAFASEPMPFPLVTESRLARRFPRSGLLRSAVVTARALSDIAGAL